MNRAVNPRQETSTLAGPGLGNIDSTTTTDPSPRSSSTDSSSRSDIFAPVNGATTTESSSITTSSSSSNSPPPPSSNSQTSSSTSNSPNSSTSSTSSAFSNPSSSTDSTTTSIVSSSSSSSSIVTTSPIESITQSSSSSSSSSRISASTTTATSGQNSAAMGTSQKCASQAGPIAGAAVGAAAATAIILGAVFFLFLRNKQGFGLGSRNRATKGKSPDPNNARASDAKAAFRGGVYDMPAIDPRPAWEKNVPQSADDSTIRLRVKTCFDQAHLYVDNFYKDMAVQQIPESARLELAKVDSPHLYGGILQTMQRTRWPTAVVKHILVQTIVASMSPLSGSGVCLLPQDFVLLPMAITQQGSKDAVGFEETSQALSRWRMLTAYLRPRPTSDPTYMAQRDESIVRIVTTLSGAFSPWFDTRQDPRAREKSLWTILRGAADLGILLFSQPSEFDFDWALRSGREQTKSVLMVAPVLVKTTNEDGWPLEKPQVVLQAVSHNV